MPIDELPPGTIAVGAITDINHTTQAFIADMVDGETQQSFCISGPISAFDPDDVIDDFGVGTYIAVTESGLKKLHVRPFTDAELAAAEREAAAMHAYLFPQLPDKGEGVIG